MHRKRERITSLLIKALLAHLKKTAYGRLYSDEKWLVVLRGSAGLRII